jgi:hypothetical protein
VASPQGIQTDATAWAYGDWLAGEFGDATQDLDFPDMAASAKFLFVGTDLYDKPKSAAAKAASPGRLIIRFPLDQIAKGGQLGGGFVKVTDVNTAKQPIAQKAHFAQNSTDGAFWAGHVDNSAVRVYRWPDASNSTDPHDVKVSSWPNNLTNLTSKGRGQVDWLSNLNGTIRNQIVAGARSGDGLWLAWTAASGDGGNGGFSFPNPHVRIV